MKKKRMLSDLTEKQYADYKLISEKYCMITEQAKWQIEYKKFCLKWFGQES